MKKFLLIVTLILGVFLVSGLFNGFVSSLSELHLKEINAIPGDVKKVLSSEIGDYAKAVVFEDNFHKTFGVATIEEKYGFLYRYDGSASGYAVEQGKPFQTIAFGGAKDFMVAIKTAEDSNIQYIALGNHLHGITPTDKYELTLEDIKENSRYYSLKEVKDNYVLFVFLKEYNEVDWTIRAFDKEGNLVADKLLPGDERYIDWN